jgi:hypothetical protein
MGQLTPLHHVGPNVPGDCPACAACNEMFNEMSITMEKASMQLACDDVAFIIALLVESTSAAAPTQDAREFFLLSFARHLDALLAQPDSHKAERHPIVMPMPNTPQ